MKVKKRTSWNKGIKWNWRNFKHTEETKKKMSESHKGVPMINRIGHLVSLKTRKKISKTLKFRYKQGMINGKYIKDRTLLKKSDDRILDVASQYWRKECKKRDNNKCKIKSKDCNGQLEIHHIYGWTKFPKLRYDINNGITLCHYHHPRSRKKEKELVTYFNNLILQK